MKEDKKKPPGFLTRFLLTFLREDLKEEVCGDLEERYRITSKNKSAWRANFGYLYQVIHYIRPFALKRTININLLPTHMFNSYIKTGWRNLLRNKGYAAINIGGLALGMAVAMIISIWIYDEVSFNRYFDNYDSIAQVYRTEVWEGKINTNDAHVTGLGTLLQSEYGAAFKHVVLVYANVDERVIAINDKKFTQQGRFMQPAGPEMLSLKMKYGSIDGLKDKNAIFISRLLAAKLFGDVDPVNQTVRMDAKWDLRVAGVYEDLPRNTEFSETTWFAPLDLFLDGGTSLDAWDNYFMCLYVQLNPGYEFTDVSKTISKAMMSHVREEVAATNPTVFLQPMSKLHLYSKFEDGVSVVSENLKFIWFYGIIGVFVLILACINFMNLSTARSEKRSREVGIRKSVGSLRIQLIYQFLSESLLIVLLAFIFSLLILKLTLPAFNQISSKTLSIPWKSPFFWAACMAFVVGTGTLAGSYPAFYLSSVNAVKALKGTFKAGRQTANPRRIMVVLQFTVSISLAIGTMIVHEQILFVKNRPVGYSRQGLLELQPASPEYSGKYEILRNELLATGVVEDVAECNYSVTSSMGWNSGFQWRGYNPQEEPSFNTVRATYDYGKTIGWEFVEGRDFSREYSTDINAIVINESAAKVMNIGHPVGESIPWRPDGNDRGIFKVVGVVKDMVKGSPYEETDPCITFLTNTDQQWLYIRIRPDQSASDALPKIQRAFNKIVPSAPFDYKFAEDAYGAKFRAEERVGTLASIFSVLAILISCLGLFGLASFMAEQRTKEMSIRKLLGASLVQMCSLLSKEFIVMLCVSCGVAIPIVYLFMTKWLEQYTYRTTPGYDTFLYAILGAFAITVLTVSFQSIKTALRNPVDSLKTE